MDGYGLVKLVLNVNILINIYYITKCMCCEEVMEICNFFLPWLFVAFNQKLLSEFKKNVVFLIINYEVSFRELKLDTDR